MGAQIRRILSLTIAGVLVMTQGTVTEASTAKTAGSIKDGTAARELTSDTGTDIEEKLVELEAIKEAASAAAPETIDTGPTDTGPGDNESGEEYEVTTNEEGQTVYRLLSTVSECLKIEMIEGETVILEGNGNTIQTDDNGIYVSGNGTLIISDVTVFGGDNTSGVGVLDKDVNITLGGDVAIQELYFGGNQLSIADDANVTLYGRGSQVQALYFVGESFSEAENAQLTLVQASYEDAKDLSNAYHISVVYGSDIGSVEYITNEDTISAEVVLPILSMRDYSFKGWYYDSSLETKYDSETAITNGMVVYAKYVDSGGRTVYFTDEQAAAEEENAVTVAYTAKKDAVVDAQSQINKIVTKQSSHDQDVGGENDITEQATTENQTENKTGNETSDVDAKETTDTVEEEYPSDISEQTNEEDRGETVFETPIWDDVGQSNSDPPGEDDTGQNILNPLIEDDTGQTDQANEITEDNTGPGIDDEGAYSAHNVETTQVEDDTGPGIGYNTGPNITVDRISEYNTGPGDTT